MNADFVLVFCNTTYLDISLTQVVGVIIVLVA